ncbi:ALK and LTK ligand 1-like isoform X3 [Syngnathus scovelli]|uniref:ALK and LTK ligand 1-like isoform X3 n=1 Tax=Syngnathus scovelli TaxID=161590 RepID=UPI002110A9D9|nr:ALK and LTK ligand 1-like isoform X3 [Syngnathus scovelli]
MLRWLSVKFVLLLVIGCCTVATLLKGSGRQEAHSVLKLMSNHSNETVAVTQRFGENTEELHTKSRSSSQLVVQSIDLRHRDKIIKHLTGPLYVNPKCRSHFHRLYHVKDCVVPAYFKRCARLLTRLANSLRCAER